MPEQVFLPHFFIFPRSLPSSSFLLPTSYLYIRTLLYSKYIFHEQAHQCLNRGFVPPPPFFVLLSSQGSLGGYSVPTSLMLGISHGEREEEELQMVGNAISLAGLVSQYTPFPSPITLTLTTC